MDSAQEIVQENRRRMAALHAPFDPISGRGSLGPRVEAVLSMPGSPGPQRLWLPAAMAAEPLGRKVLEAGRVDASDQEEWERLRMRHDFAYWAAKYAVVKRKGGGDDCPLVLTYPQRKFASAIEAQRLAGKPIRLVLLKARQWGGSTVSQLYMAWMQLTHQRGLNSLIIAHQAAGTEEIKDMFDRMLASYPEAMLYAPGQEFKPGGRKIEGVGSSRSAWRVAGRNCKIKVGTAERPDSCRGGDYNLVHLSEVGLWRTTQGKKPEDIVRAACGGILYKPGTMVVYESTANGVGNFFHREYLAARDIPASQFDAVFVAWHEIEQNSLPFADDAEEEAFAQQLLQRREADEAPSEREEAGRYLWWLWQRGATLQGIKWYIAERAKHQSHGSMAAECPTDDVEAFVNSGQAVFDMYRVEALRADCCAPRWVGAVQGHDSAELRPGVFNPASLQGLKFVEDSCGGLRVWAKPKEQEAGKIADRYVAVVDIGGRSQKADWSVIAVFDRKPMMDASERGPEVVAQWRGHIDMDKLAWKAAQIAAYYDNALLVIESNTIETHQPDRQVDGDQSLYILQQLRTAYPRLYARRQSPEDIRAGRPTKYGFHTNVNTKPMIISHLVMAVREGLYTEREEACLDEMLVYERKPNGSYGAIIGAHDDMLMTRAIGLYICQAELAPPSATAPGRQQRKFLI